MAHSARKVREPTIVHSRWLVLAEPDGYYLLDKHEQLEYSEDGITIAFFCSFDEASQRRKDLDAGYA